MRQWKIQLTVTVGSIIAFLMLIGWAGDIDYTDQIILRMSQEEYDIVRQRLAKDTGSEPSEREIARWWAEHNND